MFYDQKEANFFNLIEVERKNKHTIAFISGKTSCLGNWYELWISEKKKDNLLKRKRGKNTFFHVENKSKRQLTSFPNSLPLHNESDI